MFSCVWAADPNDPKTETSEKKSSDKKINQNLTGIKSFPEIPLNVERPVKIEVIVLLNTFYKITESNGTYEASYDIELQWHDPNVAFDPIDKGTFRQEFCLEEATSLLSKIWNPDIVIANLKEKPIKLKQCLLIYHDGKVIYTERIRGVFESDFNLFAFPFDIQKVKLLLISNRYNTNEIQFIQKQEQINASGIRDGSKISGWDLENIEYKNIIIRELDGTYFREFEVIYTLSRIPYNHLFALAPLLLIIIVPTIVTLYINAEVSTRLANWSGAILALIAMSFTLNIRYPALTSDNIIAKLIAIIFAYEFFMIALSTTLLNPTISKKIKNPYTTSEIIKFLRWSVPILFFVIVIVCILLTKLA